MKQKPKCLFWRGLDWYCKWPKSDRTFGCYHCISSRPCMAAMLNSWPIGMKFGMRVVFNERPTRAKFQPDRTTICKKICKFVFFFFCKFFLFSKAFLLYIYNTSDGNIFMTANSKKFLQIFQFVTITLKLSNFL